VTFIVSLHTLTADTAIGVDAPVTYAIDIA
jgi:hypothetical protein